MQISIKLDLDLETAADKAMFARFQQLMQGPALELPSLPPPKPPAPVAQARGKTKAGPVEKVLGPAPAPEDLNGTGPEAEDDVGLTPDVASMSPGEARDAGLALVRQAYAANHVAPVKALQKKWGIAKFYDIPVEKGHEFYSEAVRLAQSVGIQP